MASPRSLAACPAPLEPDLPWTVPYAVSVGVFYCLNLLCLALGVHLLASALEAHSCIEGVSETSIRSV